MEILKYPDPRLNVISKPVEVIDDELRQLVTDMFKTMYEAGGLGLAAIQVGVDKRLFVIDISAKQPENPIVFINPYVDVKSETLSTVNEGCLSNPGVFKEISRPDTIIVQAKNLDGKDFNVRLTGLYATVVQHEIDHLNGIMLS